MVRYVRDNFYKPLQTKLAAQGEMLDIGTANNEVTLWLDTVAHQRIHDTTKQKPAERLVQERQYLQPLPPSVLPVTSTLAKSSPLPSVNLLSQRSLHHDLAICSGRLNPNTVLSGSITLINEVFNEKTKTVIQSGI